MIAFIIELPDWLLSGQYWAGVTTGVGAMSALILYAVKDFKIF